MPQIVVNDLVKTFYVAIRQAGLLGAFMGLMKRQYRVVTALAGISLAIEPRELVGYIGPNGAGKSTTIKILSGILVPTSGRCTVNGIISWVERERHVARIGVVFGQRTQLWWDLPVIESFDLLQAIYRIPPAAYGRTRDELIALPQLERLLDVPVRQLSLGQRMRCDLAASLLHRPEILFLDEPTIGLDAVSKLAVREFVKRINREQGVTVILTTHDMDDIEALYERIIVIGAGTILSDGSLEALRVAVSGERRLIIDLLPATPTPYPPPSCGACPAPAKAARPHAPPGSEALQRAAAARGGRGNRRGRAWPAAAAYGQGDGAKKGVWISYTSQRREISRSGDKKLVTPVTLFAAIEAKQHEALRAIAFAERRSLADVVREALTLYLAQHAQPQAIPPAVAGSR